MAEAKLESTHQVFVVQQLAMFARPKDVQEALKQNFEIEISIPAVVYYDISNSALPKKLKTIFNATRSKFLKDSSKIPIANKSYRLAKIQRMFETEESTVPQLQNKKRMQSLLEQAAKEAGDVYSNKQKLEHTGKDGAPIETKQTVDLSKLTTEELIIWKKLVEKTNG